MHVMAAMQLRQLEPEPWGDRLRRARELAGLTIRQVEEILFPHVSRSALQRLEDLREPPSDRKSRGRVALLLRLYGFDGDGFGITDDDTPPVIDMAALDRLREGRDQHLPDNKNYGDDPGDNRSYPQKPLLAPIVPLLVSGSRTRQTPARRTAA